MAAGYPRVAVIASALRPRYDQRMSTPDPSPMIAEIKALLASKAGAKGPSLAAQLRRADRLLTRQARKDGAFLVQAETLAEHPKLARQLNPKALSRAHKSLRAHLNTLDPWDRRKGQVLSFLGAIAGGILLVGFAAVLVMRWRGLV